MYLRILFLFAIVILAYAPSHCNGRAFQQKQKISPLSHDSIYLEKLRKVLRVELKDVTYNKKAPNFSLLKGNDEPITFVSGKKDVSSPFIFYFQHRNKMLQVHLYDWAEELLDETEGMDPPKNYIFSLNERIELKKNKDKNAPMIRHLLVSPEGSHLDTTASCSIKIIPRKYRKGRKTPRTKMEATCYVECKPGDQPTISPTVNAAPYKYTFESRKADFVIHFQNKCNPKVHYTLKRTRTSKEKCEYTEKVKISFGKEHEYSIHN